MADEAQVARLTSQIADSMVEVHKELRDIASALQETNLPRTVERRLEDVEDLNRYGDRLREREAESARAVGAVETRAANQRLLTTYSGAQETSGSLATAIRNTDVSLQTQAAALRHAAKELDERLADVDALEKLSGLDAATTTKLRDGLNGLKSAAEDVGNGIGLTTGRLETAWTTARHLEETQLPVDIHRRHSAAIDSTAGTMRTQLRNARAGLERLRSDIGDPEASTSAVMQATQYAVQTAQKAGQAADAAADKVAGAAEVTQNAGSTTANLTSRLDPELEHSMHAGTTPRPAAGAGEPARPVDPRIDYMMPARAHGTAGQREDRDNGR